MFRPKYKRDSIRSTIERTEKERLERIRKKKKIEKGQIQLLLE